MEQVRERHHGDDGGAGQKAGLAASSGSAASPPKDGDRQARGHERRRRRRSRPGPAVAGASGCRDSCVDERLPGGLEGRQRELHHAAEGVADLVDPRPRPGSRRGRGSSGRRGSGPAPGCRAAPWAARSPGPRAAGAGEKAGAACRSSDGQQAQRVGSGGQRVAPQHARDAVAARRRGRPSAAVLTAWRKTEPGGEEPRPVLDAQAGWRARRRSCRDRRRPPPARPSVSGASVAQEHARRAGPAETTSAEQGRAPATAAKSATVPARRRRSPSVLQVVVDAEETRVEAHAEDDLGHRPEHQEQGVVPVVGGGEVGGVDGKEREVDEAREHVRRAVQGRVARQLAQVRQEASGSARSSPCPNGSTR